MTLKNPALLRAGDGSSFLDYWFERAGKGEGVLENSDGSFNVQVKLHRSAVAGFPKSARGLCGVLNEFELHEGSLYQVGLRDLTDYVCENDKYFDVKVEGLPDVLARDWKKHVGEIVKL